MLGREALVVVGENQARRNALLKQAERAKRYLVQKREFEAERLLIVDGGYQLLRTQSCIFTRFGGVVGRVYFFPKKDP